MVKIGGTGLKTILFTATGSLIGVVVSNIPTEFWHFLFNNIDTVLYTGSGIIATIYTIYQEYREHKRHGSIYHTHLINSEKKEKNKEVAH